MDRINKQPPSTNWCPTWLTKIHLKPERAWKGILDTKIQNLTQLLAVCWWCAAAQLKRGFPGSLVAEKKPCPFEMAASWALQPAQTLALSGGREFKWGL